MIVRRKTIGVNLDFIIMKLLVFSMNKSKVMTENNQRMDFNGSGCDST